MSRQLKHSVACGNNPYRKLFSNLKGVQKTIFSMACFTVLLIPFWWRFAQFPFTIMLIIALFSKIVFHKSACNHLNKLSALFFLSMCAFSAIYAISLVYSDNYSEGIIETTRKLLFMACGMVFFISDWSWLQKIHIHALMQILTISILLRFAIMIGIGAYKLYGGQIAWSDMVGLAFDPMHHCYLSLYILLALAYVLFFTFSHRLAKPVVWRYAILTLCVILLASYLFLINSRAGLLCMALLFIGVIVILLLNKRYRPALELILFYVVLLSSTALIFPQATERFRNLSSNIVNQTDDRYSITKATLNVIHSNMPFGVGAGDRMDVLIDEYKKIEAEKAYWRNYNPHNQYLDTLMTTGFPGLAILLVLTVLPVINAVRFRDYLLLSFCLIIVFCSMFESVLERQMGIVFYCFFASIFNSNFQQKHQK